MTCLSQDAPDLAAESTCLQGMGGLSKGCADCAAAFAECTFTSVVPVADASVACQSQCDGSGATTATCNACVAQHCNPAFAACSGVDGGLGGGTANCVGATGTGKTSPDCASLPTTLCGPVEAPAMAVCVAAFDGAGGTGTGFTAGSAEALLACLEAIPATDACDESAVRTCVFQVSTKACIDPSVTAACTAYQASCNGHTFDLAGCTYLLAPFANVAGAVAAVDNCVGNNVALCQESFDSCADAAGLTLALDGALWLCSPSPEPCVAASDCCAESCTNGMCDCRASEAACGADNQCCEGLCLAGKCVGPPACASNGAQCAQPADCCSGTCASGLCTFVCAPTASPCARDAECCEGVCSGNLCKCQSPGGACNPLGGPDPCCTGTACTSGSCQ